MKKAFIILASLIVISTLTGCTQNASVREYGGEATIELPVNTKLTDIEWEGEDLWYMTRPMHEDEVAETYTFQEDSSFGALEGTVTIVERKD